MTKHVLSVKEPECHVEYSAGPVIGNSESQTNVTELYIHCYYIQHGNLLLLIYLLHSVLCFCAYFFPGPWPLLIDPEDVNQVCPPPLDQYPDDAALYSISPYISPHRQTIKAKHELKRPN